MTRVLPAAAVAALALAGVAAGGGSNPSAAPRARVATARSPAAAPASRPAEVEGGLEQQTLIAINDLRLQDGLTPLRLSRQLAEAARGHSLSMAEHGFFRHASCDGSAFWSRIRSLYPPVRGRHWAAAENIVWASPGLSAQSALEMWLNSPAHRRNLLTPAWREVGLGGVHAPAAPGVYRGLNVTILTVDFGVR